jgi:hypothetical protein
VPISNKSTQHNKETTTSNKNMLYIVYQGGTNEQQEHTTQEGTHKQQEHATQVSTNEHQECIARKHQ